MQYGVINYSHHGRTQFFNALSILVRLLQTQSLFYFTSYQLLLIFAHLQVHVVVLICSCSSLRKSTLRKVGLGRTRVFLPDNPDVPLEQPQDAGFLLSHLPQGYSE